MGGWVGGWEIMRMETHTNEGAGKRGTTRGSRDERLPGYRLRGACRDPSESCAVPSHDGAGGETGMDGGTRRSVRAGGFDFARQRCRATPGDSYGRGGVIWRGDGGRDPPSGDAVSAVRRGGRHGPRDDTSTRKRDDGLDRTAQRSE